MSYLYGDSTPSPLKSNFIQFLGEALDFSVHVLGSAGRLHALGTRMLAAKEAAVAETTRLEALRASVASAVERAPKGAPESPTAACGKAILASTMELVARSTGQAAATLANELAALQIQEAQERATCERALEALLRLHDPPGAVATVHLVHQGTHYAASRRIQTAFGLVCLMELDVSGPSAFAQVVRVDRFVPHLEIQAPESGGWLRKEVKERPQRLEKYYLSEMSFAPGASTLRLRTSVEDDKGQGFDVEIRDEAPRVRMARVGGADEGAAGAFDVSAEDAEKILALHEKVQAAAFEAGRSRTKLVDARVDQQPFAQLPDPSLLVQRLVGAMAPVVQEIAMHSLAPGELILKQVVGDHRREEIFVSKASLDEKLAELGEGQRGMFRLLGLGGASGGAPQAPESRPRSVVPPPAESKPRSLAPPAPPAPESKPRSQTLPGPPEANVVVTEADMETEDDTNLLSRGPST